MAILHEMKEPEFSDWVATRPPQIQALIAKLPPNRLYRMKSTGHRVTIASYCEDGTVTVLVAGAFNLLLFDRTVFGITPDALEESDLPGPEEEVGCLFHRNA